MNSCSARSSRRSSRDQKRDPPTQLLGRHRAPGRPGLVALLWLGTSGAAVPRAVYAFHEVNEFLTKTWHLCQMSTTVIEEQTRSLDQALADLRAKHEKRPSADLARMIRQLELEIAERKGTRQGPAAKQ